MQQANQPFHYTDADGVDHFVAKGAIYDDGDPVTEGREVLFTAFATKSEPKK